MVIDDMRRVAGRGVGGVGGPSVFFSAEGRRTFLEDASPATVKGHRGNVSHVQSIAPGFPNYAER